MAPDPANPPGITIDEAAESLRRRASLHSHFGTVGIGADDEGRPALFLWIRPGGKPPSEAAGGRWAGWPLHVETLGWKRPRGRAPSGDDGPFNRPRDCGS